MRLLTCLILSISIFSMTLSFAHGDEQHETTSFNASELLQASQQSYTLFSELKPDEVAQIYGFTVRKTDDFATAKVYYMRDDGKASVEFTCHKHPSVSVAEDADQFEVECHAPH